MDILALQNLLFSPNSALLVTGIAALAMAGGGAYLALLKKRPESTVLKSEDSPLQRRLNRIENWSLSLRASYRLVLAFVLCGVAVWLAVAADEELTVTQTALSYSLGLVAILLAAGSLLWGRNERKALQSIGAHRSAARPPGPAIYGQVCALRSFEGRGDAPDLYPLLYQSTVSRLANLSLEKELPWQWKVQLRYAANAAILLGILSFLMGSLSSFVQNTASLLKENSLVNERLPMEQTPEEQLAKNDEPPPTFPPENEEQEGDSGRQSQSKGGSKSGPDASQQEKQPGKDGQQESDSNQGGQSKPEQTQEKKEGGTGQEESEKGIGKDQLPQPRPNPPGQPDTPQNARERPQEKDPNRPPDVPPEDLKEKKVPQQNAENQQKKDPNRPPEVPPEDLKEQQASENQQKRDQEQTANREQKQDSKAPSQRPEETKDSPPKHQPRPQSAQRKQDQPPGGGSKNCPAPQNGRPAGQEDPFSQKQQEGGKGSSTPKPLDPNKAPNVPPEQLSDKQAPSPLKDGEQEAGTQEAESQQPKLKQNRTEEAKRLAQPNDDGQENNSKEYGSEPGPDPLGNGGGSSNRTSKLKDTEFEDMKLKRGPSSSPEGEPKDLKPRENEPQRASAGQRYNPRTELKANRYVEPLPISPQRVPPEYRIAFRKLFQRDE